MKESYLVIATDRVVLSKNNPRKVNIGSEGFEKLAASVKAQGVVVPVHVRHDPKDANKYELLAGERRVLAAVKAGIKEISAINHGDITDAEAFEITFAENFQREDLTPLEQGAAAAILLDKYAGDYTAAASKIGKSEKWILQHALIHKQLCEEVAGAVEKDRALEYLTASHLGLIVRFPPEIQKKILKYIRTAYGQVSVKGLEQELAGWLRLIAKAPFPNTQCQSCPKRSGAQPGLFSDKAEGDTGKNDKCTDMKCWDKKETAHKKAAFEELGKKYPGGLLAVAASWMGYDVDTKKLKKIHGKIINNYDFTKAKKKDAGSVPAFVVHGTGRGKVIYVKVKKDTAKTKQPTLKELRAGLETKRRGETVRRFAARVEKIPAAERLSEDSMFATALMISVLGCGQRIYGDEKIAKFLTKAVELYKKDKKRAVETVYSHLWDAAADNLKWRMDTSGDEHSICQARLISVYFDIDLDEIYGDVCKEKEFAEPAEWAGLNANGTKKKVTITKNG